MPDTETVESIVLNPQFNYQRHVEIVKRFVEQLTAHMGQASDEQIAYVEANLDTIRDALSEVLADDIQFQIATGKFPVGRQLDLHTYEPSGDVYSRCRAVGSGLPGSCGGKPESLVHRL